MRPPQHKKARGGTRSPRTAKQKGREFEKIWPKIQKIQEEVRRLGLAENMLTDDDLYDENGLPK